MASSHAIVVTEHFQIGAPAYTAVHCAKAALSGELKARGLSQRFHLFSSAPLSLDVEGWRCLVGCSIRLPSTFIFHFLQCCITKITNEVKLNMTKHGVREDEPGLRQVTLM